MRKTKKFISTALVLTMFGSTLAGVPWGFNRAKAAEESADSRIKESLKGSVVLYIGMPEAYVNGIKSKIDAGNSTVSPIIKNDKTLVPVRFISEGLKAKVDWDAATSGVKITSGDRIVNMTLGSNKYLVDGKEYTLEVPAQEIEGRTMIPLRAMAEALDKKVFWNDSGLIAISEQNNSFSADSNLELLKGIIDLFEQSKPVNPLAFYVGRVARNYGDISKVKTEDLTQYIDTEKKTIKSITGELEWDYKDGISKVNTPKSQGATGFLSKAGSLELGDVIIESGNEFSTILAISLDDQPLSTSNKILIQAMTEEKTYGFKTEEITEKDKIGNDVRKNKITDMGSSPMNVKKIDASITLKKSNGEEKVSVLDENGYAYQEIKGEKTVQGLKVKLNPDAIYTVIERGVKTDIGKGTVEKDLNNYIIWEGENTKETNFPDVNASEFSSATFADKKDILSGGQWLSIDGKWGDDKYGKQDTWFAKYEVEVAKEGKYHFYTRKFWKHGPFEWRFDEQPWGTCSGDVSLLDSVSIRKFLGANWVYLGEVPLSKGKHQFEIKLSAKNAGEGRAAAFDCFMLTDQLVIPSALTKPGEKLGLKEDGYWAFEPSMDHFGDEAILDLRYFNEKEAGESGFIRRQDDKLVLGNGQELRAWGANVGYDAISLDKPFIDQYVKLLAKRGINMVRVHGSPYEIMNKQGKILPEKLEKLHYFISALKKEGIYTYLSFYFPLWFNMNTATGFGEYEQIKNRTPFVLLQFDEDMQAVYKSVLKDILTSNNPYTDLKIADDPAVAIVEIQNEDSYLFHTFSANNIPQKYLDKLQGLFAKWLEKKYGSTEEAITQWGEGASFEKDDINNSKLELKAAWFMTAMGAGNGGHKRRMSDQLQFLVENQKEFYGEFAEYCREELKVKSLINCSNWTTADPATLEALERYTYTPGDIIDRHGYFNSIHEGAGQQSYAVNVGDKYIDCAAVLMPDKLPIKYAQVDNYPYMISELGWTNPNRSKAEAPFLTAAYGSLQGLDAVCMFALSANWEGSVTKFPMLVPTIMGQSPGFALMYRRGDVKESDNVVSETNNLEDLYNFAGTKIDEDLSLEQLRDVK